MGIGAVTIAPAEVLAILAGRLGLDIGPEYSDRQETVLTAIRVPRVLATALVGAAWAAAGVARSGATSANRWNLGCIRDLALPSSRR